MPRSASATTEIAPGEHVGGELGTVDGIDGDVHLGLETVADLLAEVEHRGLVLLALTDHDRAFHVDRGERGADRFDCARVRRVLVAATLQGRRRQRARFGHAQQLEREVAVDLGLFNHRLTENVTEGLSQAAAADRQLVCLHQELLFARQPPVSAPVDVNARPLEHRRDPHHLASESRIEPVDEDLVFIELDLAQGPLAAGPDLGRELQLWARSLLRAWLDREPR